MFLLNKPRTMLIVDASPFNRCQLAEMFCGEYTVCMAENCEQGRKLMRLHREELSVILLDLVSPSKECIRFITEARVDERTDVPVVAMIAADDRHMEEMALEAGIHDFLSAPFDAYTTVKKINNIVARRESYGRVEELRRQEDARRLLDEVPCGIVILEAGDTVKLTFANDSFFEMFGVKHGELGLEQTGNIALALHPDDAYQFNAAVNQAVTDGGGFEISVRVITRRGKVKWVLVRGRRMSTRSAVPSFITIFTDITENKEYESELRHQAERDTLTGIYNKNAFCRRMRKLLDSGGASRYAIIYIDIRRFKVINELFGFSIGNNLLAHIAGVLYATFRKRGIFARLEADKFVVGIPSDGLDLNALVSTLSGDICSFPLDYTIQPMFGVYYVDDPSKSVDSMCDHAMLANRAVRDKGFTNCAIYNDDLRRSILTEQHIVNDMNNAIRDKQFYICLQPQYDYVTGNIVGTEALVRWNHPKLGLISPAVFVPIFERNGFITQLDEYVRELVCRHLSEWRDAGMRLIPVSVNISRVDIYDTRLADKLVCLLESYSLPPDIMHLEITESAYVEDAQQLIDAVGELRSRGFTVEMDDFGSGYSSLNMLKDVPVDVLKLDMKFVGNDGTSGRGGSILNSIVGMSRLIDLPVIAEGVETLEQAEYLKSIGCSRMQGYYFARPMPPEEYESLLVHSVRN